MENKKLKLEQISLESFVTSLKKKENESILGAQTNPNDSSKIQSCTPHGSIQTCPQTFFPCGSIESITALTVNRTIWSFCRCRNIVANPKNEE